MEFRDALALWTPVSGCRPVTGGHILSGFRSKVAVTRRQRHRCPQQLAKRGLQGISVGGPGLPPTGVVGKQRLGQEGPCGCCSEPAMGPSSHIPEQISHMMDVRPSPALTPMLLGSVMCAERTCSRLTRPSPPADCSSGAAESLLVMSTHYGLGTGARVYVDGTWSGARVHADGTLSGTRMQVHADGTWSEIRMHADGTWSGTRVQVRAVGEEPMGSPRNPAAAGTAGLWLWARPGSGTNRKAQEALALGSEGSGSAGAHSPDPRYLRGAAARKGCAGSSGAEPGGGKAGEEVDLRPPRGTGGETHRRMTGRHGILGGRVRPRSRGGSASKNLQLLLASS